MNVCRKIAIALWVGCLFFGQANAEQTVTITDLAGRSVEVSVPVKKLILGEGRYLPSLAILDRDDPTQRVVGMMGEFEKYDPASYEQYRHRYPALDDIPRIGASNASSFSLEQALSVSPDVAIFGLSSGHGPNDNDKQLLATLEAAGVPVVILDFRIDPLVNTPRSIEILGELLGRKKEADEFLSFYREQLNRVTSVLPEKSSGPTVFMESRVGLAADCCEAIGARMMGRFITAAGGRNAFGDMIPGTHGSVSREYLLLNEPDVYIGTAIGSVETEERFPQFIQLGARTLKGNAEESLQAALSRPELRELKAVKQGRAYAIWHHFYNSPMNVVAVQVIAKWLHPQSFKSLNPEETLRTYFDRFQPVPLNGVYWAHPGR
ncbi:hypothetical protein WH95_17460 [Kiloniella litopenaei]|uniref:Fe/B12 periplasmic-binding domain-containing protein n=1 Tax=Kiloniella litopenaei TaxID=1549748 RepID=A0A0M2R6H1_9PROT|nr:ABC transporter substrate-binding protein [Kiloniella litopenaei]KKJ75620.1 hypothetical protein WH95_17460 [Kiloniella litopenaei]